MENNPKSRIRSERFRQLEQKELLRSIRSYVLIVAGVFAAAFGLKGFLLANGFIDGGVTGISLLLHRVFNWPLSLLILLINVPFIVMGYTQVGRSFALKTAAAVLLLSFVLWACPFPVVTSDKLLVAVFGGFFLGAGIGIAIRGGSVIDGTEVLSLYMSRKTGLSIGDFILLVNVLIFSVAAFLLDLETALYSMLTYLAASKTVDFFVNGIEEYTGVTIVSEKSDAIRNAIIHLMGRGVTLYKGQRGYGKRGQQTDDIDVVFTVITRLEVARLNSLIETIDAEAFVVMHSIRDTKGGMIKKRALH